MSLRESKGSEAEGEEERGTWNRSGADFCFLLQELPFRHLGHGLTTLRTLVNRMEAKQEDGQVKRTCMIPEKRT